MERYKNIWNVTNIYIERHKYMERAETLCHTFQSFPPVFLSVNIILAQITVNGGIILAHVTVNGGIILAHVTVNGGIILAHITVNGGTILAQITVNGCMIFAPRTLHSGNSLVSFFTM
jgi:hypothetical protein